MLNGEDLTDDRSDAGLINTESNKDTWFHKAGAKPGISQYVQ